MEDAVSKNRQAKGTSLPQTKLSDGEKSEIIESAKAGVPYKNLATRYSVTPQLIGKIAIKKGVRRRVSQ